MSYVWLMYLGGVSESLQFVLVLIAIVCVVAAITHALWCIGDGEKPWPFLKTLIVVGTTCLIVSVLVPSRSVFYTLAAVYAGRDLSSMPIADKATKAAEAILDRIILESSEKEKK